MSWFRVCDNLHAHRKARRAGAESMGLWVMCGSHASSQAAAGSGAMYLDEIESIALTLGLKGWRKAMDRLVDVGLWDRTEDGIVFHDWAEYREGGDAELARRRAKDAKRKREKYSPRRNGDESPEFSAENPRSRPENTPHLPVPSRPVPSQRREEPPPADASSVRPPPDPELGDVFMASLASAGFPVALPTFAWKDLSTAAAVHWPELTPAARREALGAAAKAWASEADAFTRERGFTPKLFVSWLNARAASPPVPSGAANDAARAAQIEKNKAYKLARARAEADAAEGDPEVASA